MAILRRILMWMMHILFPIAFVLPTHNALTAFYQGSPELGLMWLLIVSIVALMWDAIKEPTSAKR
jgi:hypothetical protein